MISVVYRNGDQHIILREVWGKVAVEGIGMCELSLPMNGFGFFLEFPDGTIMATDTKKILEEMFKLYLEDFAKGGIQS